MCKVRFNLAAIFGEILLQECARATKIGALLLQVVDFLLTCDSRCRLCVSCQNGAVVLASNNLLNDLRLEATFSATPP